MLDKEKSNIKYSAKHVLHAWEGINNDVSGVAVYNESISKIALAAQVIDFDSGNSGRDSHSLEVLEALKAKKRNERRSRVSSYEAAGGGKGRPKRVPKPGVS